MKEAGEDEGRKVVWRKEVIIEWMKEGGVGEGR